MDYPEIDADRDLNLPVGELTRKFYRDIMKSYERTTKEFAAIVRELQEQLVDIAGIVDSPWMHEQRGIKMRDPRTIGIQELLPVVRKAAIDAHIEKTRIREKYASQETLQDEVRLLKAANEGLMRENAALSANVSNLTSQLSAARESLAAASKGEQQVVPAENVMMLPTTDAELHPHYERFVAEKLFEAAMFAIDKTASAGEIRSPDLRRLMAERLGIDENGGAIYDALDLCEDYGALQKYMSDKAEKGGRRPYVYLATPMIGAYFYEQNTGKTYVTPEYLKAHGHGQSLLVLEAENILREAGYEILKSQQMKNTDGTGQFYPDIVASRNGITIYCEVERNTPRENQNPDPKWRNFRQYSNGQMYVFVNDPRSKQATLRYAITAMISPNDRVHICEIDKARKHLQEKGTIWTLVHSAGGPVRD